MARANIRVIKIGFKDTIEFLRDIDRSLFTGATLRWKRKLVNDMARATT